MPQKKRQPKKRKADEQPAKNEAEAPDPNKLTADELADLLRRAGAGNVDAAKVAIDIANGVPTINEKVSLLHYTSWLVKQLTK